LLCCPLALGDLFHKGGIFVREVIMALLAGFVLGVIFCRLKLPVPAPPTLAGVMGIVGIFLGYIVATKMLGWGK